jgi:fatty acid desaturase
VFPFCPTLRIIWLIQSVAFAIGISKHSNTKYRSYATAERLTMAAHWAWYLTLLYFASHRFWFVLITQCLPGFGIAIIVFFNHYACHHYKDVNEKFDFIDLVLETTRDLNPGVLTDWICGGLNYQIEHHLFPTMPRHNLSIAAKHVQQFCKQHKLTYQSADFIEGIGMLLKQLAEVSDVLEKIKTHES